MSHHLNQDQCPLCRDKLLQADMRLQVWFLKDVKPAYPDVHISWSYRNQEDQENAFNDHKSKLHYPHSSHNKVDRAGKPCSRALDLFQLDDDNVAWFPYKLYKNIALTLDHDQMIWGGNFRHFGDSDHFELI